MRRESHLYPASECVKSKSLNQMRVALESRIWPLRALEKPREVRDAGEEETAAGTAAQGAPSDDLPAAGAVPSGVCPGAFPPPDPGRCRGAGQEPVRPGSPRRHGLL